MPKKDDDDLPVLPRKPVGKKLVPGGRAPSAPMTRLIRIARAIGIALGGFVTVVALMSLVGVVTDIFWVRLVVALLVGLALPALAADRVLKRTSMGGGIATVVDVFAIVLLAIAIAFVGLEGFTRGMMRSEGDRYARAGSTVMARVVYFVAGVAPTFPDEAGWKGEIADAGAGTFLRLEDGGLVAVSPVTGLPLAARPDGGAK